MFYIAVLLPLATALMTAPGANCGEPETELHYTNAMENYRGGDYKTALKNVREYISADPANRAKKQFAVKLLLKMAANSHQEKRDAQAMEYLKTARSYEDNAQVNDLYLDVEAALNPSPDAISQETASANDIIPGNDFALSSWPGGGQTGGSVPKKPAKPAPLPVKSKPARRSPAALEKPGAPREQRTTAYAANVTKPERLLKKSAPAARHIRAEPNNVFIKAAVIASSILMFFAATAFLYLRRIRNRLLHDTSVKIQDALNNLQGEKAQIQEEKTRMLKAFEAQIAKEREKIDVAEQRRQEDWDCKEKERHEAWEKAEMARLRAEELQARNSELRREKETRREEPPPAAPLEAEDNSHKPLIIDAREAVRQLKFKNLAARLLAYKSFAARLDDIYELNKETALEAIKPLLNNSDPGIRAYLAGGLSQLPRPESAALLLKLWDDSDANVRGESLRGLLSFSKRQDFASVFHEPLRTQIKRLIEQEAARKEWVF